MVCSRRTIEAECETAHAEIGQAPDGVGTQQRRAARRHRHRQPQPHAVRHQLVQIRSFQRISAGQYEYRATQFTNLFEQRHAFGGRELP